MLTTRGEIAAEVLSHGHVTSAVSSSQAKLAEGTFLEMISRHHKII